MRWPTARQRPSSSGRSCVLAVSTDSCRIGRLFVRRRRTRKVFARLLPAEPYWRERGPGGVVVAAGTVLELAIPFTDLGLSADSPVAFFVALFDDSGAELERQPAHRPIELVAPDAMFEARNWRA